MTQQVQKSKNTDYNGTLLKSRARRHCFTWYNYTAEDLERCKGIICDYITFGFEICPTTMKPHLQGYVEWDTGISGRQCLERLLGTTDITNNSVRLSAADKNRFANIAYCQKAESKDPSAEVPFYERITKEKHQGQRNDIVYADVVDTIHKTGTFFDIVNNFPEIAIKYHSGIDRCIREINDNNNVNLAKEQYIS